MKADLNSFKTVGHTLDLTKEQRSYDRLKLSSAEACAAAPLPLPLVRLHRT